MHALLILLLAFLSANSRLGENPQDASGLPVECSVSGELPLDSCGSCASTTPECLVAASSAAGGFCFATGTLVATEDGQRPIEQVNAGERVWSCDLTSGDWRLCKVAETYVFDHVGDLVEVFVAGRKIESTYHHPYWVVEGQNLGDRPKPDHVASAEVSGAIVPGRWVDAGDLQIGDVLLLQDGRQLPVEEILVRQVEDHVYNFAVDGLHNYAVGPNRVLVHNNCAASNVLTQAEQRAIQKIENNLADHLTTSDLTGALRDMVGNPVPKPGGGFFNHVKEVNDAVNGLRNGIKTLTGSANPAAQAAIQRAEAMIAYLESFFAGAGL